MCLQIKTFIRNCDLCKETKPANDIMRPPMGAQTITVRPFQKLYVDFLGKYPRSKAGNTYIFIVMDHFSKFVFLKPMREATTKNVTKFLVTEVFHKFGVPETIHSDNGKQFTSVEFTKMIEAYKINHIKTGIHAPQANASERVNQTVLAAIRTYLKEDHREWDLYLSEIECALRSAVHSATGVSPYFALFGQQMFISGEEYKLARKLSSLDETSFECLRKEDKLEIIRDKMSANMKIAYERNATQYNKRTKEIQFRPGQEVFKRNFFLSNFAKNINAKFAKRFTKARIIRAVGRSLYEIESLQGRYLGVYHAKDLKQ